MSLRSLQISLTFMFCLKIPVPIDFFPGTPLPTSRLYSLVKPDRKAKECYITDSLAAEIIQPSTFTRVKGEEQVPTNAVVLRFELLQGATVFPNLDLCNHHLVRICKGDHFVYLRYQTSISPCRSQIH